MKKFYALQYTFKDIVQQYPNLLLKVNTTQRKHMLETFDIYDIMTSASSFFQSDIVMEANVLYMKNTVTKEDYYIECQKDHIVFDMENNPFLQLLKRKYRYFLITDYD